MVDVDKEFKDDLKSNLGKDFMQQILKRWSQCTESNNKNLQSLLEILQEIDRFDIYDDCYENFKLDAEIFKERGVQNITSDNKVVNIILSDDRRRLANGLNPLIYDAFLLYSENDEEDENLAGKVITFFKEKGLRICTKNDLDAGLTFEYHACMELINNRCRRVIVIVSKSFLGSKAEQFLIKFAQDSDIRKDTRKIVPCLREECEISFYLQNLFHLKYYRRGVMLDFWGKLYESVEYHPALEKSLETSEFTYVPLKPIEYSKPAQKEQLKEAEQLKLLETSPSVKDLPDPASESPLNSSSLSIEKKHKRKFVKSLKKKIKTIINGKEKPLNTKVALT